MGWEYNLDGWPWYTNSGNVDTFKTAFRRVVGIMRAEAPGLKFEFGLNCASGLNGSGDRLASLTEGYPGDEYVDLVGCDKYSWWGETGANFDKVLRSDRGPGVQDVVDFARAHGKGASFGEWGLAANHNGGGSGDDPAFIQGMWDFFQANRDVVVMEAYFDEPDSYIESSLYRNGQNPNAGARYRSLW